MLAEYIEGQGAPMQEGGPLNRSSPMPGVTACSYQFSSVGEGKALQAPPERLEAVLCQTGRLRVRLNGGHTEVVGPGDLLLLTSRARMESLSVELAPAAGFAAEAEKSAVEGFLSAHPLPVFDAWTDILRLWQRIDEGWGCLVLHDPDWSNSTLAALRRLPPERRGGYFTLRLLERLCVLYHEGPPRWEGRTPYYDLYQKEAVKRVHDYMLTNLEQPATIQALALQFQMSPTYLKESFRQIYGKPIHAYLLQYRMQKAAHLLSTSGESVLTIASRVGYSGTSRFNAAFREAYHMTPTQYRRMGGEKMSKKE